LGKTIKPQGLKTKPPSRKSRLFLLNFLLFLGPMTYYGYQPLLRYSPIILMTDDEPQKSDVIVVLAGGEPGRAWDAADLYKRGLAPYVVLTKDVPNVDEQELRKHGIEVVDGHGNYLRVLRGMGVPESKIITVEPYVQDTLSEMTRIRELLEHRGWKSLIIVTSNYHTRRSRLAARYVLGSGIKFTIVGSGHGGLNRNGWWRRPADVRTVLIEFEKLVAYTLYIWPRMII
jgi:uncharacterized SAM-binding protein YcdF (DUF218 family)